MRRVPSETPVSRATSRIVMLPLTLSGRHRVEAPPRPSPAEPHPALRGSERDAADPRDLLRGEPATVGQQQRVALVAREGLAHAQQRARSLAPQPGVGRALGGLGDRAGFSLGTLDRALARAARAPAIER